MLSAKPNSFCTNGDSFFWTGSDGDAMSIYVHRAALTRPDFHVVHLVDPGRRNMVLLGHAVVTFIIPFLNRQGECNMLCALLTRKSGKVSEGAIDHNNSSRKTNASVTLNIHPSYKRSWAACGIGTYSDLHGHSLFFFTLAGKAESRGKSGQDALKARLPHMRALPHKRLILKFDSS